MPWPPLDSPCTPSFSNPPWPNKREEREMRVPQFRSAGGASWPDLFVLPTRESAPCPQGSPLVRHVSYRTGAFAGGAGGNREGGRAGPTFVGSSGARAMLGAGGCASRFTWGIV